MAALETASLRWFLRRESAPLYPAATSSGLNAPRFDRAVVKEIPFCSVSGPISGESRIERNKDTMSVFFSSSTAVSANREKGGASALLLTARPGNSCWLKQKKKHSV